jgi:GT2 family glycosyltransferase
MNAPGPLRVAVIDVANPISDLDCTRAAQPPYAGAFILACRSGRPLGIVQVPLHGTRITAPELERELRRQLGDAWSRTSSYRNGDAPKLARASVVVPSILGRPAQLRRCLERLAELDHPDYEVIVVDNRPGDPPPADLAGARVVREPHPGISAARNRGIATATGEIIAFTDDDVAVDRRWLRALCERFARQPDVAAITGLVVPGELETSAQVLFEQSGNSPDRVFVPLTFERIGRFQVIRHAPEEGGDRVHSLYAIGEFGLGSNMAFRTSVLRAVGGFDEALGTGTPARGGEDLAMFLELLARGHQLAYEPEAITFHSHRDSLAQLEDQIHGYGIGFTAMLTAVALRDPRHLAGLAAALAPWLRSLRDPANAKQAHRTEDYPSGLARAELRGMLGGPFAYLRSRQVQRRWAHDEQAVGLEVAAR